MEKAKKAAQEEVTLEKRAEIDDEQMKGVVGGTATLKYAGVTYTCDAEESTQQMFNTYSNPNFWSQGKCPYYVYDQIHIRPEGITNCSSCTHYHTEKKMGLGMGCN